MVSLQNNRTTNQNAKCERIWLKLSHISYPEQTNFFEELPFVLWVGVVVFFFVLFFPITRALRHPSPFLFSSWSIFFFLTQFLVNTLNSSYHNSSIVITWKNPSGISSNICLFFSFIPLIAKNNSKHCSSAPQWHYQCLFFSLLSFLQYINSQLILLPVEWIFKALLLCI